MVTILRSERAEHSLFQDTPIVVSFQIETENNTPLTRFRLTHSDAHCDVERNMSHHASAF